MTEDSIKSKIKSLLAKAEGTDNPHEQEVFMAKVNELLARHQIDMAAIRSHGEAEKMVRENGETNIYASMTWAKQVAWGAAAYFGGKILFGKRGNHRPYDVYGTQSVVTTIELMLPYLISQVRQRAGTFAKAYGVTRSQAERDIGVALAGRLYRLADSAKQARKDIATSSNALIPVADLDAFVATYVPQVKKSKGKIKGYSYEAQDAASKISLNAQTTHDEKRMIG